MGNIAINFDFFSSIPLIYLKGIGIHTYKPKDNYFWNNRNRKNKHSILQYTLDGFGELEIKGKKYLINKNEAFFIDIPNESSYYLPKESKKWKVFYFELSKEILPLLHQIYILNGPILYFNNNSQILSKMFKILYKAKNNDLNDIYINAKITHSFMIDLIIYLSKSKKYIPLKISKCKKYIEENYFNQMINLDFLSNYTNLTKFHLTREFEKYIGITPIKYLNEIRLKKSIELLISKPELNLNKIANNIGFSDGNYFGKVFKNNYGITPNKFRKGKYKNKSEVIIKSLISEI